MWTAKKKRIRRIWAKNPDWASRPPVWMQTSWLWDLIPVKLNLILIEGASFVSSNNLHHFPAFLALDVLLPVSKVMTLLSSNVGPLERKGLRTKDRNMWMCSCRNIKYNLYFTCFQLTFLKVKQKNALLGRLQKQHQVQKKKCSTYIILQRDGQALRRSNKWINILGNGWGKVQVMQTKAEFQT